MSNMRMRAGTLAVLAAGLLGACTNPVSSGTHTQPDGVVIRQTGTVVASNTPQGVTGQLTVQAGQAGEPLSVHFVQAGEEIAPPAGYYLDVPATAQAEWVPDVAGGFTGHIRGLGAGSTTLSFRWMHGAVGRGHPDATRTIPVVVTP
jgi:hypothetical protein